MPYMGAKQLSNLSTYRNLDIPLHRRIPMKRSRRQKIFINLLLISLFILTFSGALLAQSGTSRISGIVSDPNDAAVAGATVRISNPATGFSRTVTTGEDGAYSFPGIPPATYRL